MSLAIYLLAGLGCLGAFDTLYYHEWRANLPVLGRAARSELQLHAWRDFVYAILFATPAIPEAFRWAMLVMATGVFLSGVRDFCASNGWRASAWPWRPKS